MAVTINLYPGIISPEAGGNQSALAVSGAAASVIVGQPIRLRKIVVLTAPTTTVTFNDAATVGAASASNAIISIPSTAVVGAIYLLDWPCTAGLVQSSTGGGSFSISLG